MNKPKRKRKIRPIEILIAAMMIILIIMIIVFMATRPRYDQAIVPMEQGKIKIEDSTYGPGVSFFVLRVMGYYYYIVTITKDGHIEYTEVTR